MARDAVLCAFRPPKAMPTEPGLMLASLPMYDLPELRPATDAWWAGLASALRRQGMTGVPEQLSRDGGFGAEWRDSGLLLSQCCGWDLSHEQAGWLQVVATPVYVAPGCSGSRYRSLFMVHGDDSARHLVDLRGRRCAVNMIGSQSGYNALRYALAPLARGQRCFTTVIETGSHAASLAAVQSGRADLAAIDCVTFALLERHRPAATMGLRLLAYSRKAPALPYVTRIGLPPELLMALRAALVQALNDPALAAAREALLIGGFEVLPAAAYRYILDQERRAGRLGYPRLV